MSRLTPQYGLLSIHLRQPLGSYSSSTFFVKSHHCFSVRPTRSQGFSAFASVSGSTRLVGSEPRVELGAVRTPVAVRVAAARVGAERHLLAVSEAVAVNVVVAGDRVFAVEQAVVVEVRVAGSRVTRIAVAVAVGVRVAGIGVPGALARVADPVAVAVVALRIAQRGGPRERRRGP